MLVYRFALFPSLPDNVGECCPSAAFVRPFVGTDLVTTTSQERLKQSRWNLQWI